MSTNPKSRWTEDQGESAEEIAQRKLGKEQRRSAKEERLRKATEQVSKPQHAPTEQDPAVNGDVQRPAKRQRTSAEPESRNAQNAEGESKILTFPAARFARCRDVEEYELLNNIEEGSYGMVSRARSRATGEIVALKRLKMDHAADGFPVTGLREIQTLMASHHENIVKLVEVVTSTDLKE
jgi:cell division cycle 2-like